jgi:hypothetical protein
MLSGRHNNDPTSLVPIFYISYFSHCWDKIHDMNNLREKGFILAHSLRDLSSWFLDSGSMVSQSIMVVGVCDRCSLPHG